MLLAGSSEEAAVEAEPKIQDHAEGDIRGSKGTAAGLKRKTEGGPTPPQSKKKLECGPMPNVMVALPNIGGALCSMPQSLADSGMPCSNTAKT